MSDFWYKRQDKAFATMLERTRLVFEDMMNSGEFFQFYGVDANRFKIGDSVLEAVENEEDGYRSCFGALAVPDGPENIFFGSAIDRVRIVEVKNQTVEYDYRKTGPQESWRNFDGWDLVAADGHRWLRFGTDNNEDYYPSFVFTYTPRGA